jgi:hypothetical protein
MPEPEETLSRDIGEKPRNMTSTNGPETPHPNRSTLKKVAWREHEYLY